MCHALVASLSLGRAAAGASRLLFAAPAAALSLRLQCSFLKEPVSTCIAGRGLCTSDSYGSRAWWSTGSVPAHTNAAQGRAHTTDATNGAEERFSAAAESAAAAYNAELDYLLSLGLSRPAATAVQESWYNGRIRAPALDGTTLHQSRARPMSVRKMLVRIRQLLQAHKAAATRAGAASPAVAGATASHQASQAAVSISSQGAAALRPEKLPSGPEPPEAAAAGASGGAAANASGGAAADASGVAGSAAARQLDWGDVDIQRIIAMDPVVIMVPWQELAQRLNSLLNGMCPLLGYHLAVQHIHKSPSLRFMLSDPAAAVSKLWGRHEVYLDVLGVPPQPTLLAASQSSFLRTTLPTFRSKLESLVQRWGADTTHALLSAQPHLLSSKSSSVDINSRSVQELLGCTDKEMGRVVRKAPRLLSTNVKRVAANYQDLMRLLMPIGMVEHDVRRLVMKVPLLLLLNPVATSAKLEASKALLGSSAHRLQTFITQEPSLLGASTCSLAQKVDSLQQLMCCSRDTVSAMIAAAPSLCTYAPSFVANRVEELTQVLALPVPDVKKLCCRSPAILTLRPELLNSKLEAWAGALKLGKPAVIKTVIMYPRLFVFDTEVIAAHMAMLKALVSRSWLWSYQASGSALPGKTSRPSRALYPGHAGAVAFIAEAKAALRPFFPELTRSELADLARTHWAQYKMRMVPVGQESKQMRQARLMQQHAQRVGGHHLVSSSSSCSSSTTVGAGSAAAGSHPGLPSMARQAEESSTLLGNHQAAGQLQPAQQLGQAPDDAAATWPLKFSRNPSGRTLLRMEYLLATGLHAEETLSSCVGKSEAQWNAAHPAYSEWLQLRLHHLQQGSSEWPEVLVQRVVALYSTPLGGSQPTTRQKRRLHRSNAPSADGRTAAAATVVK